MKLFIVNVGVNSAEAQKYFIKSPLFKDGKFELIPIMESNARANFSDCIYKNLKCHNNKNKFLREYMPEDMWDMKAHNDPEFETYTYGDNYKKPKGANFLKAKKGDILLFIARLYKYDKGKFLDNGAQYFISYFKISEIIIYNRSKEITDDSLNNNIHYRRYKKGMHETFIIFKGEKNNSFRFKKALKVSPEICELIFNAQYIEEHDLFICNETGDVLKNKNGNSRRFRNFHSITRSVQYYLDDSNQSQSVPLNDLINLLNEHI